jgi:protocatechuate 3,4-dioxygenase beta subunit
MNDDRFPPTEPRRLPPAEPTAAPDPDPQPPARGSGVIGRRTALALLAGGGAAALLAAVRQGRGGGGSSTLSADTGSTAKTAATTVSSVGRIPEETAGPYPGDGTNGPNVLTQSGIVRSDIRRSVGSGSATADGVPLTIELTIVDADTGEPYLPPPEHAGAAVYLWHCDRIGRYSMYSSGLGSENYLRGVQVADSNGVLRFTSIFPGAYDGRWPHIHFHVFDSQAQATNGRNARVTSQLALPESVCDQVYATSGYESSARNLSRSSLASDMVFRDGSDLQLATLTGSTSAGYVARLVVGV